MTRFYWKRAFHILPVVGMAGGFIWTGSIEASLLVGAVLFFGSVIPLVAIEMEEAAERQRDELLKDNAKSFNSGARN